MQRIIDSHFHIWDPSVQPLSWLDGTDGVPSGRFPEHSVPYLEFDRLILRRIRIGNHMQAQHILGKFLAGGCKREKDSGYGK